MGRPRYLGFNLCAKNAVAPSLVPTKLVAGRLKLTRTRCRMARLSRMPMTVMGLATAIPPATATRTRTRF